MCVMCGPGPGEAVIDHTIDHPFELKSKTDYDCATCGEHVSIHPDKIEWLRKHEENMILDRGFMVRSIFPNQGDEGTTFAYSVGRSLFDKPEFFITGLGSSTMQYIINRVADLESERGPFNDGDDIDEVLEGLPVRIRTVNSLEAADMGGVTSRFPSAQALQILWPDPAGKFPGDMDFDPVFGQDLP